MSTKRLFFAIPLPIEFADYLSKISSIFPGKKTARENLHITVHFIGKFEEIKIGEMIEKVKPLIESVEFFELKFKGFMYKKGYNPMVWATFEESSQFRSLSLKVKSCLEAYDLRTTPHVTLVRLKAPEAIFFPDPQPFSVRVKAVELWESLRTHCGTVYFPLKKITLSDGIA